MLTGTFVNKDGLPHSDVQLYYLLSYLFRVLSVQNFQLSNRVASFLLFQTC
jgi:hypothetical protein